MNNDEFIYYFHGTNISNPSLINDVFNNGLINYGGNDMGYTMTRIDMENSNLFKQAVEYKMSHGFNDIFVIKIPKYYLYPKVVNGELQQAPMPIWKPLKTGDIKGNAAQLCPQLIHSVIDVDNQKVISNPNYSPVHNPAGLQYDVAQIDNLRNYATEDWINFASKRSNYSYEELLSSDEKNHIWDYYIAIYSEHFGIDKESEHNNRR